MKFRFDPMDFAHWCFYIGMGIFMLSSFTKCAYDEWRDVINPKVRVEVKA